MSPRFYLDEDVTERLLDVIAAIGHDVASPKQLGRKGSRDFEQLLFAATRRLALITLNGSDFRLLHGAWLSWSEAWGARSVAQHAGILVIEPGSGRDGALSLTLLASVVQSFADLPTEATNRLFAWNRSRGLHEVGEPAAR